MNDTKQSTEDSGDRFQQDYVVRLDSYVAGQTRCLSLAGHFNLLVSRTIQSPPQFLSWSHGIYHRTGRRSQRSLILFGEDY